MSTGLDCQFIESESGWTYSIEVHSVFWPKCQRRGPFPSLEIARTHMDAHYENPGSWTETPLKGRTT